MWLSKIGVIVTLFAVCLSPLLALAHATPISYTPVAGATELTTPSSISVRFTERIEMGASSLTVFGPNGEEVNQGKGELDASDERVLSVPITDAGQGVYAVSWQVVSVDDGHFTKGAFSFLVDETGKVFEGQQGGVEIAYSSKLPEALLSFTNLLGESIFLALLLFALCIARPSVSAGRISPALQESLRNMFVHLIWLGYVLFVFGSTISFLRKSSELAQLQSTSFLEGSLVYLGSSVGTFTALKVLGITILCAAMLLFSQKLFTGPGKKIFIAWSAILASVLIMQAYVSHAAASFFLPEFSIAATFVHLVAKELIIGGAVLLFVLCLFCIQKQSLGLFAFSARRYDRIVSIALLCAAVSGVYITWLHLKHFDHIASTEWGTRFVELLIATVLFGFFRLFHQFIVHPKLDKKKWQKIASVTLAGEVTAGMLVLFVSGYISITTPPFTVEKYEFLQTSISEDVSVKFEVHPYEHGSFRVEFTDARTGAPAAVSGITVTATNEEKSIGPNVIEAQRRAPGVYAFPVASLSPAGNWELGVIAAQDGRYDAQASFSLSYPKDIEGARTSDDVRPFDAFAMLFMAIGIGGALFSLALYAHARKQEKKSIVIENAVSLPEAIAPKMMVGRMLLASLVLGLFAIASAIFVQSSFERMCLRDGFAWQQAFPTRNFEATSPNAMNGCTVHDGHYHFVDEREYESFKKIH